MDTWWSFLLSIHSSPLLAKSPPPTPIPPPGTKSSSTWVCAPGLSNQSILSPGHNDSLRLGTSLVWSNDSQVQGVCQGWGALSTNIKLWGSLMKPEKKVNSKQHRQLKRDRSLMTLLWVLGSTLTANLALTLSATLATKFLLCPKPTGKSPSPICLLYWEYSEDKKTGESNCLMTDCPQVRATMETVQLAFPRTHNYNYQHTFKEYQFIITDPFCSRGCLVFSTPCSVNGLCCFPTMVGWRKSLDPDQDYQSAVYPCPY